MLRALVRKEWRQLRLLRWGGAGLIAIFPPLLIAAGEAAERGWLPFGSVADSTVGTILADAVPAVFGLAVWPLLALLLTAQTYCGDLAAGTEAFWIERPVPPSRVWLARLSAVVANLGVVFGVHLVTWRGLVWMWGDVVDDGVLPGQVLLMGGLLNTGMHAFTMGLALAGCALLAGLASSSLARSPAQAVFAGLILFVLPIGLGYLLTALFPFAGFRRGYTSGLFFGALLFPLYSAIAYRVSCSGEPSGRGRIRRALVLIALAVAAIGVVFAPIATWATYRDAVNGLGNAKIAYATANDRALIRGSQLGAWLVDIGKGELIRRLDPYIDSMAWDGAGQRVALLKYDLGGGSVLEVRDGDGRLLSGPRNCGNGASVGWHGDKIVVIVPDAEGNWSLALAAIETLELEPIEMDACPGILWLVSPAEAGQTHVFCSSDQGAASDRSGTTTLRRLHGDTASLGTAIEVAEATVPRRSGMSPSGRYVNLATRAERVVLDLVSGERYEVESQPQWLVHDGLATVIDTAEGPALLLGDVETRRVASVFPAVDGIGISANGNGTRLLVRLSSRRDTGPDKWVWHYEFRLLDVTTGTWLDIETPSGTTIQWGGEATLIVTAPGLLALRGVEEQAPLRFLIGGD